MNLWVAPVSRFDNEVDRAGLVLATLPVPLNLSLVSVAVGLPADNSEITLALVLPEPMRRNTKTAP